MDLLGGDRVQQDHKVLKVIKVTLVLKVLKVLKARREHKAMMQV